MTDFEQKLQNQLNKEIDQINPNVLDQIMRTPFEEKKTQEKKRFSPRLVRNLSLSLCLVLVLSFGLLIPGMTKTEGGGVPMVARFFASAPEIGISEDLEALLKTKTAKQRVVVQATSIYEKEDLKKIASGENKTLASEDKASGGKPLVYTVILSKEEILIVKEIAYLEIGK